MKLFLIVQKALDLLLAVLSGSADPKSLEGRIVRAATVADKVVDKAATAVQAAEQHRQDVKAKVADQASRAVESTEQGIQALKERADALKRLI